MVWHVWGEGPALVLLHGGYGSWTHWFRNVLPLSKRFRVLAADIPGLGDSAMQEEPYTADGIAAIVAHGLDSLLQPDETFSIVGFSFGGLIGGHVALQRRARLKRYVMVGPGGLGLKRGDPPQLVKWHKLPAGPERDAGHRQNLEMLMFADPGTVDPVSLHLQAENARRGRTKSRPLSRTDSLARAIRQLGAPIAGIWGARDVSHSPYLELRRELLREVQPDAPYVVIEGAGHWVAYEAADRFNESLIQILED